MTPRADGLAQQNAFVMNLVSIDIAGLTGELCVTRVRHAVDGVLGVRHAEVKVGRALVTYEASATNETQIRDAIRGAGYTPAEP